MSEFIAVIGRFTPIGYDKKNYDKRDGKDTSSCGIGAKGEPLCQKVRLERVVPEPSVSAEQAQKEFLDLTREL